MKLKWWEKTVEYLFVAYAVAKKKMAFGIPLDGDHERAGDAIFAAANRWILIEFKRDRTTIASEKEKFANFETARQMLGASDGHHYIVYGESAKNERGSMYLDLKYVTYFSGVQKTFDEMLASGAGEAAFSLYLKRLTSLKQIPAGSSGGGLMMDDYSLVAGVGENNAIVECVSLAQVQRALNLRREIERPAPSHDISRSRGMER